MGDQYADKAELYEDDDGEWRWRAKSSNGQIVASSGEGYQNHADALKAVESLFPAVKIEDPLAK